MSARRSPKRSTALVNLVAVPYNDSALAKDARGARAASSIAVNKEEKAVEFRADNGVLDEFRVVIMSSTAWTIV